MLVAIEGIDGAGKNTLVRALQEAAPAEVISFPRYRESMPAELAAEALHGRMGDCSDSPYAMATLFALDRYGARAELEGADARGLVLCDRYVASNAAYSLARTGDHEIVRWVEELEFGRLGLPRPDLTVLLDTPPQLAGERAQQRERTDATRARDVYERDARLQERTWQAYLELARSGWSSRWLVTSKPRDILVALGLD
ncbi:thymidylate kinase [Corynebacterium atypicum]|uniref:Thymidylate kinase n=1 Tax=Corynebacterium atypicum TaxID=191610 RepID=A0ABM5QLU3_9CORY|nr:dTMP kinase [Corynebacterium atypicum]AIG63781.1 thymidylate kinase [Corynebacterium atypicum]